MRSKVGLLGGFAAIVVLLSSLLAAAPAANAAAGFGQVTGAGGCLGGIEAGSGSACPATPGIFSPKALAVSPDGRNVYVVGGHSGDNVASSFGAIAILRRNPETGALSAAGCVSSDGSDGIEAETGRCASSPALLGADGVAVSPDGATVFVTAAASASVVAFARNAETGALTRLGCLQGFPRPGSPCRGADIFPQAGEVLAGSSALYIGSPVEAAISGLAAAPATSEAGAGTGAAAAAATAASPAAIFTAPGESYFVNPCIAENGLDGACTIGTAMRGAEGMVLSPGGTQLYAAARESAAIDVFTPGAAGALTESGCLKQKAPAGLCSSSSLLEKPTALAVTPDGHDLYATDSGTTGGRVDVLTRAADGSLADSSCVDQKPPEVHEEEKGEEGEEAEEKTSAPPAPPDKCAQVPGLESAIAVESNSEGTSLYVFGHNSAVTFSRDPATGRLSEVSCAASADTRCASLAALQEVSAAAASPDGRNVYVVAGDTVVALGIGAAVTSPTAAASSDGLARISVACPRAMKRACRGRLLLTRAVLARTSGHSHERRVLRSVVARSASFSIGPGRQLPVSVRIAAPARRLLLAQRHLRVEAVVDAAPLGGGSGFGRAVHVRFR